MNLDEATQKGIARIRRPTWAFADSYLKLHLEQQADGTFLRGPWLHLYSRTEQQLIGEPTPQTLLGLDDTTTDYEEYTGPADEADK